MFFSHTRTSKFILIKLWNSEFIRPERYEKRKTTTTFRMFQFLSSLFFNFSYSNTFCVAVFCLFEENNSRIMFYMPPSDDSFIQNISQVGLTQLWVIKCQFTCNSVAFFGLFLILPRFVVSFANYESDMARVKLANIKCVCLTVSSS